MVNLTIHNHRLSIGFRNIVSIDAIVCMLSDINYTKIFLKDGRVKVISLSIKYFEEALTDYPFFRSHKCCLVNLNYIDKFYECDSTFALTNKQIAPISRRKIKEYKQYISQLSA